jgi:hypothetical protein
MDRGYIDFARLHALDQAGAFFVTRAKSNLRAHRVYSAAADRTAGVISDQTIALDGIQSRKDYPDKLRRIRFNDAKTGQTLVFLTNRQDLPAMTICDLYKTAGRSNFSSSGSSSTFGSRFCCNVWYWS